MQRHDLIVIGAGPGGYVAALRAAQLGLDTASVDEHDRLGGTCLRVGCIPSKALLESSHLYEQARRSLQPHGIEAGDVQLDLGRMLARKDRVVEQLTGGIDGLYRKHGVTRYRGRARFTAPRKLVVERDGRAVEELEAGHVLVATGSRPATLKGVEPDGDRIGTSTEALAWPEVPRMLAVIGAGYIGLELGTVWRRLGAEVTVLEYLDRILPGTDGEIAREARKLFEKQGLKFRLESRVTSASVRKNRCRIELEGGEAVEADRVLIAVGRVPHTEGLDLGAAGVEHNERGFIEVDEAFRTSAEGVYAIGDCIGGPLLAHKAEEEGIACIERIATGWGHVDYAAIPSVVYTHPEIAAVGPTEEELKERGVAYRKGRFPFRANGRAFTLGETDGLIKVLADKTTDRLLAVHILGPRAGDIIAEAAAAIAYGASSEDLARTCHAHPTLSEALKEAALAVDERALHV
ncbi:MAG: dihydrolipoyl dehydrogenase [Planctomycetes bacterium]|nr:dihydrolipoyl dehydrogenase [Planctomycetota bacterium]